MLPRRCYTTGRGQEERPREARKRRGRRPLAANAVLAALRSRVVERFDAIVVGAGPGGLGDGHPPRPRRARACSLVDKARFPRDKPCGGGSDAPGRPRAARLGRRRWSSTSSTASAFRLGYGTRFERRAAAGRSIADDAAPAARPAPARAGRRRRRRRPRRREGDGGRRRRERASRPASTAARSEADVLVGADGVNGRVRQALGLGGTYVLGVALEGNVAHEVVGETGTAACAVLELGTIPGGYGWVFPKGDHVNVGVGGWEREGPGLRSISPSSAGSTASPATSRRGDPRSPPAAAPARTRSRRAAARCSSATPRVSSTRSRETGCTRRSSARGSPPARCSTCWRAGPTRSTPTRSELAAALGSLAPASWGAKIALDRYPRATFALGRVAARVARDGAHGPRGDQRAVGGARAHASAAEGDRRARARGPAIRAARTGSRRAPPKRHRLPAAENGSGGRARRRRRLLRCRP